VIDAATNTVTATVGVGTNPLSLGLFIGPAAPPAPAAATAIPTLSEWGVILLSGLLGLAGLWGWRRRA